MPRLGVEPSRLGVTRSTCQHRTGLTALWDVNVHCLYCSQAARIGIELNEIILSNSPSRQWPCRKESMEPGDRMLGFDKTRKARPIKVRRISTHLENFSAFDETRDPEVIQA